MLYIRMILIMAVTLYTSRVVLQVLGIEDYGIYNVVGGVIALLGFLNTSLSGASSRFITFALGKNDEISLKNTFSSVLCIHFVLAGVIVLLGETIGLWFVYNQLVIPEERMVAAICVYHSSILTMVISIISVPYNSLIIAHERMNVFAYISIIEAILKLSVVWVLFVVNTDKLIVYAVLILLVQLLIRIIYGRYCYNSFQESHVSLKWDKKLVRDMSVYIGWSLNGHIALIGYTQGINILLNLFFGPVVNAARGIAVQVQSATQSFVGNFQTAIRPQIVKSYASNDFSYMHTLVIASSKFGFYLTLMLVFPLLLFTPTILHIWLGVIPEHTISFVRIMLIISLIEPLKSPLIAAVHATGDIKKFQLYEGSMLLSIVPLSYVILKFVFDIPETVFIVYLAVELLTQCVRIWIALDKVSMKFSLYCKEVVLPIVFMLPFLMIVMYFIDMYEIMSFVVLVCKSILVVVLLAAILYAIGLKKDERRFINNQMKKLFHHYKK